MIRLIDLYDGARIREGALEFLYELMKERDPEINISHSTLPTFEQHRAFWTRRVYRVCYLIEGRPQEPLEGIGGPMPFEPVWLGYVSATYNNEIGIVLRKDHRAKGYGPLAVQELMRRHDPLPAEPSVRNGHWLANIAPANEPSKRMFQALGFRKIQETYEFNEEKNHGNEEAAPA